MKTFERIQSISITSIFFVSSFLLFTDVPFTNGDYQKKLFCFQELLSCHIHYDSSSISLLFLSFLESTILAEKILSSVNYRLPNDFTDSRPCVLSNMRDLTRYAWTSLQIPSSFDWSRNALFELNGIKSIYYLILDKNCLKSAQQLKLVNLPQLQILIVKDLACENVKELYLESKEMNYDYKTRSS